MITAIQADISTLETDAIVNAANETLLGGGGVDGAIHRAAGPDLLKACRKLGGCPTGEARITDGYLLPAKHVIHTVGPVWRGGQHNEPALLRSCYWQSLELARQHHLNSIAFPCISTGAYHYPPAQAASIALQTVLEHQQETGYDMDVTFCCFSEASLSLYRQQLSSSLHLNYPPTSPLLLTPPQPSRPCEAASALPYPTRLPPTPLSSR
jgi:O-acetyl-ADP-ribose deacetylase (regulator of RNase III)